MFVRGLKKWVLCLPKVQQINIEFVRKLHVLQKLDVAFGKWLTEMAKLLGRVHAQGGGQGENKAGAEQRIQRWS